MPDTLLTHRVHRRMYRDSVALMSIASDLEKMDGVTQAGAVMATPANHDILARSGMLPADLDADPDDLVIVVRAADQQAGEAALDRATEALTARVDAGAGSASLTYPPRTVAEALDKSPAELVTISVPGAYAGAVSQDALTAGCHVFCFSDNVSLDDENRLKALAAEKNLLHMGPDCGTAIIDGVPLGFANDVPRGRVGMIAASGTGAQEVSTLLARAGIGMRHIIGVGGRDLAGKVTHPAAYVALDYLAEDDDVDLIVVVSKPPAHDVAETLLAKLEGAGKPALACLLGEPDEDGAVAVRGTLEGAAIAVAQRYGREIETGGPAVAAAPRPSTIVGLYTGGTLAHEAHILTDRAGASARILDLGDDEYTQGRPHPMISPDLRAHMIEELGEDADARVLLLDLVIGWGAAPDPATPVAAAVRAARERAANDGRELIALASVTGTRTDHQGFDAQRAILTDAGIAVFDTNAAAVRAAIDLSVKER